MRLSSRRFQRVTSVLLTAAIVLLVVSVILQGILCVSILWFHRSVEVVITNREVPVNVQNYDLDVNVTNSDLDVNVENHRIVEGDPIPVTVVR